MLVVKVGVIAVLRDEFVVRAQFYYLPLVEHGNPVGVPDGRDAVGNENSGAPLHQFAEMVEDLVFRVGVDAGERVIEDEDARAAQNGSGNGRALLLAS